MTKREIKENNFRTLYKKVMHAAEHAVSEAEINDLWKELENTELTKSDIKIIEKNLSFASKQAAFRRSK